MNVEKQRSFCDWKTISLKGIQYFLLGWIFNIQVLSCCLASFVSFTGVTVCWYYWRKLFSNIHQSQMFTYDPLCHTMCSNNSHLRLLAKYFCKGYLYATQKAEKLKLSRIQMEAVIIFVRVVRILKFWLFYKKKTFFDSKSGFWSEKSDLSTHSEC